MRRRLPLLIATACLVSAVTACSPSDDAGDCAGLSALAHSTNVQGWKENEGWLTDTSVCNWFGVKCGSPSLGALSRRRRKGGGRVTEITLKNNGLKGSIPTDIGRLTALQTLDLAGKRPDNYVGCSGTDFGKAALPAGLFFLRQLSTLNLEYSCTGGSLPPAGVANLTRMRSLQLHGNYIGGTIPIEMAAMKDIEVFKLGRNPLQGQLPLFTTFSKVIQFNCNFCALSGPFPDTIFDHMPSLQITYWDGNGFNGTLPSSLARAKQLQRMSFNINQFTGAIPAGICNIPAGQGGDTPDTKHDCRIGSDTDLSAYQAQSYPWIIKGHGNLYDCDMIPSCAHSGSCNKTVGKKVVNPLSPVRCK